MQSNEHTQAVVDAVAALDAASPKPSRVATLPNATTRYIAMLDPERDAELIAAAKERAAEAGGDVTDLRAARELVKSLQRVLRNHNVTNS